jgi:hypothetical protein
MILAIVLAAALAQQPQEKPPDVTVMKAALGGLCSAEFTVKDEAGKPVFGASVRVRVRYGFMSVKRADLEVGTSYLGKARIEGLPDKARPLEYEIQKDMKRVSVEQLVEERCNATFDVVLK